MAFKNPLDEIKERKSSKGEFKIIPRSEVYKVYRKIDEKMQKFKEEQFLQNIKSEEAARNIFLG